MPSLQDAWHMVQRMKGGFCLIYSEFDLASPSFVVWAPPAGKLHAVPSPLCSVVIQIYLLLCGHLYMYVNADWKKDKICFLRPGISEFKDTIIKFDQTELTLALCAQEHLPMVMQDLCLGIGWILCSTFTSYCILLLTAGAHIISCLFLQSGWSVIFVFSWRWKTHEKRSYNIF